LNIDHAYLGSGVKLTKVSDLKPNIHVYFAGPQENFIQETDETAFSTQAETKRSERKFASSTVESLTSLYDSYSAFVKSKSPAFVSNTITKVENTVTQVVTSPTVSQYTAYVLGWADDKLDRAYDRWSNVRDSFVNSEFAKTVNTSYQRIYEPADIFYRGLVEEWLSLNKKGEVIFVDFINGVKTKWGSRWNDNLVEPTQKFFERAKQEYADLMKKQDGKSTVSSIFDNLKNKLGSQWETTVQTNFKSRLQEPAEGFYRSAVTTFANIDKNMDAKLHYNQYLTSLKTSLGSFWNESLLTPAKHLYDSFIHTNNTSNTNNTSDTTPKTV